MKRRETRSRSAGTTWARQGGRIHPALLWSMAALCAHLALLFLVISANAATPAATPAPTQAPTQAATPPPARAGTRFEGFADAVQYVLLGHADTAEIAEDPTARPLVEKAIGQKTRVRVIVRKIADLGGDGCKRIGTKFIALDAQLKTKEGQPAGAWAGEMAMNLCEGGQPPEPGGN